jgi:hypothetical protein
LKTVAVCWENRPPQDFDLPDGPKRKRTHETVAELGDEEPSKKPRSSTKSDLSDPIDDDTPLSLFAFGRRDWEIRLGNFANQYAIVIEIHGITERLR